MGNSIRIEDIEHMRRENGIYDVELREQIRSLQIGHCVKLTLLRDELPSEGKTVVVRITSVRDGRFCGKLAVPSQASRMPGLLPGRVVRFSAAQIHSVVRGAQDEDS